MKFIFGMRRLAILVALSACGGDSGTEPAAVITQYNVIVKASYASALAGAQSLKTAVDAFVAAPSDATLTAARNAWIASRPAYQQTEAYRFYGGPIDDPDDDRELRINSWPLDESYIDGLVQGDATLDKQLLIDANFQNGETNVSTGYHAIEFLLWGGDESASGPGNRPFTDYTAEQDAVRRGQYLTLAAELLVDDLGFVASRWDASYPTELLTVPSNEALRRILTGIGALASAELSGERMQVAYENRDQEDEHSCFSDNTLNDLFNNAKGIENVYLGRFGSVTGPSLHDLVTAKDQALADRLVTEIADAMTAIQAVPPPFDQAILDDANGRPRLLEAIRAVQTVGDSIVDASVALGITINPNP